MSNELNRCLINYDDTASELLEALTDTATTAELYEEDINVTWKELFSRIDEGKLEAIMDEMNRLNNEVGYYLRNDVGQSLYNKQ